MCTGSSLGRPEPTTGALKRRTGITLRDFGPLELVSRRRLPRFYFPKGPVGHFGNLKKGPVGGTPLIVLYANHGSRPSGHAVALPPSDPQGTPNSSPAPGPAAPHRGTRQASGSRLLSSSPPRRLARPPDRAP